VHELLNVDIRLAAEIFHLAKTGPYDCAHGAIMKRVGIQTILSADISDFQKIPGIKPLDPLKYKQS
jgi:predicted nucleic acid-binding protein